MIDRNADLAHWCERWLMLPYVAVDTEFERTETFFPIAGLIQIGDGEAAYLIDPLAITDWSPLVALLQSPDVIKVLHACSEDLEVFMKLCGVAPMPLFDTQMAAAYLGMDFSMGYSRLVKALLDIDLSNAETRSNWLQRPLSPNQITYAAADALHLAELYQVLGPRIEAAGLTDWLLEDSAELVNAAARIQEPETAYLNVKQAWRLKPSELAVLKVLASWRERESRQRDQARNRLLREKTLCPLAQRQPDSLQALSRIEDMHPRSVRQDGQAILDLIRAGQEVPEHDWPQRLPEPLPAEANKLLKVLKKVGQQHASTLGMAEELMLRKKHLEALVRSGYPGGPYQLPDELNGWRRVLMGEQLLAVANARDQAE
ncbi:ribonuclease D [Halopseudomonas pelagia]|uniref:Ribonuclease D n=2 Tax=Halopseudomonas pelagia TaxID=553151 RepID=A0AA92IKH9_9GAMM|nr:ribonuclease D [Halopseudomonas pelagia]PCD00327.1 ribonuclease D [Halopseudomonas pelagia]QFY58802.1 ribonuclease D [Halopseudomonas pelagia]